VLRVRGAPDAATKKTVKRKKHSFFLFLFFLRVALRF
jgi:hypothetical protein